jgi:hypothetical protein
MGRAASLRGFVSSSSTGSAQTATTQTSSRAVTDMRLAGDPRLATRRSGVLAIVSRSTLLGYLRVRPRTKRRPGISRHGVEDSHVNGANPRPAPGRGAAVTRPQPPFRQYSFPSSAVTRISGRPSPSGSARIGSPTRRPSATDQSRRGLPSRSLDRGHTRRFRLTGTPHQPQDCPGATRAGDRDPARRSFAPGCSRPRSHRPEAVLAL